ncbi:SDR family NAD(P)-dependent oxidoreductase [Kitasatospora sp. NPDC058201]|uniref:type I polyketide synthase n=1 Tax=unclassified Kitasatospora TaxID=2633591 RepID=UPI0036654F90
MSASSAEPIAIVGVGCRFPGGVESPTGLWRLAAAGHQTVGPVPAGRWRAARLAACHDPDDAARAGLGCFLDGDIWAWDPVALSVAPAEQRWVDPQFRLLAEVAWEAVEHAGLPMARVRGSRTGVYVGTYAPDNLFREARPVEDAPNSPYLFGNFAAGAAGRVAFAMDLRGPVMVVSTHCSSGLVAVDAACGALTLGECDTALAGAVLLMVSPETQYCEAPLLLSQRGACYAFDARADGYVRGEGAGVLVLRRLADARRDGDRVLAVIRGSAVNNDGQSGRLTAPSTLMQQRLFREAVEKAGIDPGEVGLVEAHGPGTAVGDPVEYTSIDAVYGRGRGRCALGSVKTNIGHSEPVSGIAGTIKALECLRRGVIPPNLNFREWNPAIPRDGRSRLFVPTELTLWPVEDGTRLAAVCSYGVTGTNAHLVLEAAPPLPRPTRPTSSRSRSGPAGAQDPSAPGDTDGSAGAFLIPVSGTSPQSLALAAARLADWAEDEGAAVPLLDIAHTLTMRRSPMDHRLGIVARHHHELATRARAFVEGRPTAGVASGVPELPPSHPGPVFVFTGQGSQRAGMCQALLHGEAAFRAAIEEMEGLVLREAGFSLREMIDRPEQLVGLSRIQPTLFAVHVALARLWRSWGIEPVAVIGQSLGEVAAVVVAGGLSLPDGVRLICRRSSLLAAVSGGAMASVMLGADDVRAAIDEAGASGVALGVLTSPGSTVVSGDSAEIAALTARWEAAGVVVRRIDVDVASHSPQVDPVLDELRTALADLPPARPALTFYSTVAHDPREPGLLDAAYWVRNQRETVRFHTAVSAALADGHRLFIECTAHPLAVRPVLDTARHDGVHDAVALGSLQQGEEDQDAFLTHLGRLLAAGYDGIDFSTRYGPGRLAEVPGIAWHRTRHGGDTAPYRLVAPQLVAATQHPLLGGFVHDPDHTERYLWQTPVSPVRLPWLDDHRVADVPVLPGTGMVEMMLAAAVRLYGSDRVETSGVSVLTPLILDPEPLVTTRLVRTGDTALVEIVTAGDTGGVVVHARGTVRALPEHDSPSALTPAELDPDGWQDSEVAALHRTFRDKHSVVHGPAFTAIDRVQVHPADDLAVARLRTHESARVSAWPMSLHPALADQVVQSAVAVWLAHHTLTPGPVVVTGFERVRVFGPTAHTRRAAVRLHEADDLGCTASARLATADGTVVAEIRGLRVRNVTSPTERFTARLSHQEWVPAAAPGDRPRATDGTWTLLAAEDTAWSTELAAQLDARTAGCRHQSLSSALGDPTAPPRCSGVVLALGDERPGESPADSSRTLISHAVTLVRRLSQWDHPPRLWALSRAGRSPLSTAAVRGLFRTLAYEHPELWPSVLEFTEGTTPHADIVAELLDDRQLLTETALLPHGRCTAQVLAGPDTARTAPPPVRPGAAYLVTGGLGGLGLLTVEWLARHGAGRIVVNARSTPTDRTRVKLQALRATGSDVVVVRGDIADPAVTARAVTAAGRGGGTLRGVFHAAGVVEDATVANLDDRLLERVWRGKAEGAWALHRATEQTDLDHFVVYSSVASLIGSPGQAAYSAANAFLDGLVAHRLHHGLPATAIQWGAWSDVGRGRHLADRGFLTITPADGIEALERILSAGHRQVAYSPLDPDRWTAPYPALRSSVLLAPLLLPDDTMDDATDIRARLLASGDPSQRRELLVAFVIETVRDLLGRTTHHIGPHTGMVSLGLDSLGAVQLQQRLQRALRTEMKPGVIWVKPSAAALADWLLDHLGLAADGQDPKPAGS